MKAPTTSATNGCRSIPFDAASCNGGSNQRWEFQNLGNGYHRIIARHSGKCLDVDAASTANSARIIQWTCNGGQNQQFMRNTA